MELKIEKLDNQGRGIGYINNKIIFVPKCLPGEIIEAKIIKENKKYYEGEFIRLIKSSQNRVDSICPYFNKCGGCNLLNISYEKTLEYKEQKIKEILKKYLDCEINISIIGCEINNNYRNKVIFHIKNGIFGLIDETNNLIEINNCMMLSNNINEIIDYLKLLKINNGKVLVRINYQNEIIVSIETNDLIEIKEPNNNIIGVMLNEEIIYGRDFFIECINDLKFKVSYKSFFQINRYITSKLFNLIKSNINKDSNILDLYCGVGTLGLAASTNAKSVIGIDSLESNIKDAKYNAKLNNIKNISFIHGDASIFNNYIKDIDTLIVDPPRNGLNKDTIKKIIEYEPNKIIYISCDPFSLVRDLKELNKYNIEKYFLMDMFPYTHHVESVVILKK